MNITDLQLKKIAVAGGVKEVDDLSVKGSDNYFELGKYNVSSDWEVVFSLRLINQGCIDTVEFKTAIEPFDKKAARQEMENLGLIERL